jgi:uncharacterized protein YyaL (SSP411 family)
VFSLLAQLVATHGMESDIAKKSLEMSNLTLTKMAEGGIFDHIGYGFHRYSVTADWHVPQ